ncbi:MAG: T9SS type A sorting domain-containing protein [Bacteroidota bacterium]|nr:T9SS type A sorting domain-containing protein [Bacteroidota bacterium]
MFKKSIIITAFVLGSLLLSSYSWILYGPEGIKANKVYVGEPGGVICVDSGMYLVPDFAPTWEFFPFPAWGAIELNMDTLLIIHAEGSWSDGIYTFDLQTHEFSPVEYCLNPNFIIRKGKYYVGHEYGLLESTDGISWTEVNTFYNKKCLDMVSIGYSDLAVATDTVSNNVLYSEDHGMNWNQLTSDFKISELVAVRYNHLGGLSKSGDVPGFYLLDGEHWELSYGDFEINTLGRDLYGNPFLGWHSSPKSNEGIARCHLTQPYSTLEFFNEGLPDLNINYITYPPLMVGGNIVFCCTDTGVFYSNDFALNLEDRIQNQIEINAFPNPFTTSTTFEYSFEKPSDVTIIIYNSQGQVVERMQERQDKGVQRVEWSAEGLPAGLYIIRLQAGNNIAFSKLLLAR